MLRLTSLGKQSVQNTANLISINRAATIHSSTFTSAPTERPAPDWCRVLPPDLERMTPEAPAKPKRILS